MDTDSDGSDDHKIYARLMGSGYGWGTIYNLSYGEVPDADLEVSGPAGGDHIIVDVSLADIGNPQAIDIRVNNFEYLYDHKEYAFTYDVVNNDAVLVDGDGSDWTEISPAASDSVEGIDPSEFDLTDFYTNNGSMLFHRFNVVGMPTTRLLGMNSKFSRGGAHPNFLYDVDRDNTTGWSYFGMGLDYHVEVYIEATSSGRSSSSYLRRLVDDNWENVKPVKIDYGSVFELAVPISDLGITTGESIDVLVGRIESLIGSYF